MKTNDTTLPTLTAKERKAIYLAAAKFIIANMEKDNYICNVIGIEILGWRNNSENSFDAYVNEERFPEFFSFRDFQCGAWLTHSYIWDLVEAPRTVINENKLTILYLCAEMCK